MKLDDAIIEKYKSFGVSADKIVADNMLSSFRSFIGGAFVNEDLKLIATRLISLRKAGKLPKLRDAGEKKESIYVTEMGVIYKLTPEKWKKYCAKCVVNMKHGISKPEIKDHATKIGYIEANITDWDKEDYENAS